VVALFAAGTFASFGMPSSEEVVLAFEEEGLEVGDYYPVEEEMGWGKSPVPNTFEEATRFEIPSLGRDAGGRVFVFENRENLKVVHDYYKELEDMPIFGPALHSHLYEDGLVLLQINGELPKQKADQYGEVLENVV
jgi:hypothetical protein